MDERDFYSKAPDTKKTLFSRPNSRCRHRFEIPGDQTVTLV